MGHRVLAPGKHTVDTAANLLDVIRAAYVIPTQAERERIIREGVAAIEAETGFTADLPAKTLLEVVNLSEYPQPLVSTFDEEFLQVPEEIIVDAMLMHQRYFPLYDADGKLTNKFIIVSNGNPECAATIIDGNERVVRARLDDAKFFYEEDLKYPLESYIEKLDKVVFQESLGTVRQKAERLEKLACAFSADAQLDAADAADKLTTFSNMVVFSSYSVQVIMSFLLMSMVFVLWPRADVSAQRVLEVLDTEPLITDGTRSDAGEAGKQGEIEFRNVSFTYPDSREAMLEGINFTAKKGETVAFIGSTGSGKSSLINLVPRFYDATQGEVLVDGVNVRDYTLKALRDKIGYVPQQSFLFKGTIASNVSYGDNPLDTTDAGIVDMTDTSTAAGRKREKELIATQNEHRTLTSEQRADVRNACEVAQATEFIATKEKQYDSAISQGGSNVSGGQKQRLSIARAVYRHPEILIFDDSFSALDFKTDRAVRDALAKEAKDSTKLIVAQRIGTIMDADRIVVLDDGKVVGQGTHSELLENCDVYRQIAQSQLSEDELNGGKSGESKLPGETGKPIETGKPSVESELNESEGR